MVASGVSFFGVDLRDVSGASVCGGALATQFYCVCGVWIYLFMQYGYI